MTPKLAFWKWFLLGSVAAVVLLVGQAASVGGSSGLLQVGELSTLRPLIEAQLGEVPLSPNTGHDGQIFYAIGLDLIGKEVPAELDHGAYRYRRILFPAVASIFGILDGKALLLGMIIVVVASAGVAAGLMATLAVRFGRSDWFALVVLLNPGVWLAVRLLTSDILALALMLVGLYMVVARKKSAPWVFALSGLAKDAFVVTPVGMAVSRDRSRWALALVPVGVLLAWMTILTLTMGDGFTGRGNLTWPLLGLVDSLPLWGEVPLADLLYGLFALASVVVGLIYSVLARSWLRWSILGWSLLGLVSSNWVWDLGNNAARAFAPIVVLIALARLGQLNDFSLSPSGGPRRVD